MPRRAELLCLMLAHGLAAIGLTVLICFATATLLDGLSRSLADNPIEAVGDLGGFVVAAAVSACFPLAQLQRSNITIEILGTALGPRAHAILRAFAAVLVAITMAAMARQMLIYAGDDAAAGDTTVMLGVPTAPFWFVVGAMFTCAAAVQALVAVLDIMRCASGAAPPPPRIAH